MEEQQTVDLELNECLDENEIMDIHQQLKGVFNHLLETGSNLQRIIIRYEPKINKTLFGTGGGRYNSTFTDHFKHTPEQTIEDNTGVIFRYINDIMRKIYEYEYPGHRKVLLYLRYYGKKNQRLELFGTLTRTRKLKTFVF